MAKLFISGDLDAALTKFAEMTKSEGVIKDYNHHSAFRAPSEIRHEAAYRAKRKQQAREERARLRREDRRHHKGI